MPATLVVDFFKRFELAGGKIGQRGLFAHQLGYGFSKLVKRPRPSLNNFTVINAAGLFGQHLFVLSDQKFGVAVLGFALRLLGVCRDNGCTIVKGAAAQILTAERIDVDGIPR